MTDDNIIQMKVSSGADVAKLGSAIQKMVTENPGKAIELRAIGAGAVNQSLKGAAIARGYLASSSRYDLAVIPRFTDIDMNGETRSAISLTVVNLADKGV